MFDLFHPATWSTAGLNYEAGQKSHVALDASGRLQADAKGVIELQLLEFLAGALIPMIENR